VPPEGVIGMGDVAGRQARSRWTFAAVLSIAVLAAACDGRGAEIAPSPRGAATELSGTVTFFGYEDSMRDEVMGPFEEQHPNLTVRKAPYSSGDEAITKLRGGFQADVVEICVEDTRRMIELGLIQPIDPGRITYWDDLFPSLKQADGVQIDGKFWLVPEQGGTSGIVYDPERVPEGMDSFADLFDPRYEGQIALEDTALTTIAVAALAMDHADPWSLTDADLERVKGFLIERKGNIRTLYRGDSDFLNLYRSGEIVAGYGYPDYVLAMEKEQIPAAFSFASEGQLTWICGYGLSANAQNLDAAYAILNWQTEPQTQAFFAEEYHYLVSNRRTLDLLDEKLIRRIGLDRPEQLAKAIPLVVPENYDRWLEVWREFKAA
jgi:spermidine/putrescine transport system substrate-binding protein